jgi:hypothetical protein
MGGGVVARILQRGATLAAATVAVVIGGTGIALGATTQDVATPPAPAPVAALATPTPLPGVAPVQPLVTQVTTVVTSTVRTITAPTETKTPAPTSVPPAGPVASASHGKPTASVAKPAKQPRRHPRRLRVARHVSLLWAEGRLSSTANDDAFAQRTDPAVAPNVAPTATGTLADLPAPIRDTLPTALVIVAASILAALGAGHLGRWYAARR